MDPEYLFLAGLALLTLILMRRAFRRRKTTSVESVLPIPLAATQQTGMGNEPIELMRWQIEMHETARNLKAELDTKMGLLQQLIHIAEAKRAELEQTIARTDANDQTNSADAH